jgi:tetratricopeptide (TPR) repeat protein
MSNVIGLKTEDSPTTGRRGVPRVALLTLALGVLTVVATYLWVEPRWQERALQAASIETLRAKAAVMPENARVQYYLGKRLLASGDVSGAFDALTRAADKSPGDFAVWKATADAAGALNGSLGAINLLAAFVKNNPDNVVARIAFSQAYIDAGAYRQAYSEAKNATELAPKSAEAWRLRGISAVAAENAPFVTEGLQQLKGHPGGLAGARGGLQDHGGPGGEGPADGHQLVVDGQAIGQGPWGQRTWRMPSTGW